MTPLPDLRRDLAVACFTVSAVAAVPAIAGAWADATGASARPTNPQRIVTLGAATTETVVALGRGAQIAATDASSREIEGVAGKATLGSVRTIGAEGVLSAGPDLILATEAVAPASAIDQIRDAQVPVAVFSDRPTVDAAKDRIHAIGSLLGAKARAVELVAELERDLAAARALKPEKAERVLFVRSQGGAALQMAGTGTIADTMVGLAGGVNALGDREGYSPVTPEAVREAAPDVLLLTTHGVARLGGEDAIWTIPEVAPLARGSVRLVVVDHDLLLGFGPRTGAAALHLARELYPPSAPEGAPG
ncbi:MAG: hemin ABC transporter substrate-binding protein [Deltaproteobacteria bacterium]|nr:hemin ABC transporter substrate-binding protein [Deltaproteobacteria bacterium]HCH61910.1 hemin ABC transporter substrate-binding protein [Deltaproteobacteria bacterium]